MDYLQQPVWFKLRKFLRYVRLYGPGRAWVKVRAQYHMRSAGSGGVRLRRRNRSDAHVGVIGCGKFAYTTIGYFLTRNFGPVIRGTMDIEPGRAASLGRRYGAQYATDEARRVIEDPEIDLVFIASNHASHAEYATQALAAGKHVHIEKPHVVTEDQLIGLCNAMRTANGRVALGFNRPESDLGREVQRYLGQQQGSSMFNWFVAGHPIEPGHWYYDEAEGGRVLGNLCHWTDFLFRMISPEDRFPIEIHPTRAEQADEDIAVTYVFGDGSIGAITFSAKGHAFEGVKERLSLQRGDLLLTLADFKWLEADVGPRKQRTRLRFRDHGHEEAVRRSYRMSQRGGAKTPGCSVAYVWETGQLFLLTRQALEEQRVLTLRPFRSDMLKLPGAAEPSL